MDRSRFYGANYSPSMNVWYPIVFDGKNVQKLEPRRTRDEATTDARAHFDRLFYSAPPLREWVPE